MGHGSRKNHKRTAIRQAASALLVTTAIVAGIGLGTLLADTLNIPYSNVNTGDTITAAIWNSNFQSIEDIVNGLINDANIENAGITGSTKLVDLSVPLGKLAGDSVNSSKIVDGSIANADILDGTIAEAKLDVTSAPTTGYYMVWDGSKMDWQAPACSGMLTFGADTPTDATGYDYYPIPYGEGNATETSVDEFIVPADFTATGIAVGLSSATGIGKTRSFTLRDDGVSTAVTCTIAATTSECNANGFAVTVAAGSKLTIYQVNTGADPGHTRFRGSVCMGGILQ